MHVQTTDKNRIAVAYWLLFVAFSIFLMVIVGGATRLTESGLSMVNWNPVTGTLPPLSEQSWQNEFSDYKNSPEYQIKNSGMSLEDFKGIFYWEWAHRLLGRLIGLIFFVPMCWFWLKGRIPSGYEPKLVVLFVLGGAQGLLGWYMVMSGLVDEPAVSHYRLAAHLGLALFLFAATFWTALSLLNPKPILMSAGMKRLTHASMLVLVLQLFMGALVAGLKAGHIFNTWPLMGERFAPDGLMSLSPWWRNLLDNAVTTQFDHRMGAYVLTALVVVLFIKSRAEGATVLKASSILLATILLQMVMGIVMLLQYVPVSWGTAHQGGGVLVLAALTYLMHLGRRNTAK